MAHVADRPFQGMPFVNPGAITKSKQALLASLLGGMEESHFYETFVQCFICKDIMLRKGMFSSHCCRIPHSKDGRSLTSHSLIPSSGSRFRIRARMGMIQGDCPQTPLLRSLTSRSSSPAPTEIISDTGPEAGPSGSQQTSPEPDYDPESSGDEGGDETEGLSDDFEFPPLSALLRGEMP